MKKFILSSLIVIVIAWTSIRFFGQPKGAIPVSVANVKTETSSALVSKSVVQDLAKAFSEGDMSSQEQLFTKLQGVLLHDWEANPQLFPEVADAILDEVLARSLRLGLLQALIEGGSPPAIPQLVRVFHNTKDDEIARAVVQKLPDLQGEARLLDQKVSVTPELISALEMEPVNSDLIEPLTVALTKMADTKAVTYLIDLVDSGAHSIDEINSTTSNRVSAAAYTLATQRILSNDAVPALSGMLFNNASSPVRKYMSAMALAAIGSPEAVSPLIHFLENSPKSFVAPAEMLASRIVQPEALQNLKHAADADVFQAPEIASAINEVLKQSDPAQ